MSAKKHAKPYASTPFSDTNLPRVGQRVRAVADLRGRTGIIPQGTLCDVVAVGPKGVITVDGYVAVRGAATPAINRDSWDATMFESVRGKPFIPGVDVRRPNNPSAEPIRTGSYVIVEEDGSETVLPEEPTVAELDAALDEISPRAAERVAVRASGRRGGKTAGSVEDAIRSLVESVAAAPAGVNEDEVKRIAMGVVKPVADALVEEIRMGAETGEAVKTLDASLTAMESQVTALDGEIKLVRDALAAAPPSAMARARMALSTGAASGNVLLDELTKYYAPGVDMGVNVLLAAPPSLGKSYTARQLGESYNVYLEHGCSDDMDEVATLLGSPIPDGSGGFIIVDGVLTQAMREAASGKNVLFLFDEILRLSPRAQEWLLTFLTGVKTPTGRVYRLRTRRALADGSLEVLEAEAKHLHILGATNLGMLNPIEAFWSRFETVRVEFDVKNVESIARSMAHAFGISTPDALCTAWGQIVTESRVAVADGRLRFPADMRIFERGCMLASEPSASAVGTWIADRLTDNLAHWNIDTGDTLPESVAVCDSWKALLKSTY